MRASGQEPVSQMLAWFKSGLRGATWGVMAALLPAVHAGETPPNVLLVLLDDVGVDLVAAYGEHPQPGRTPVLDSLAEQGVLFTNAWSTPYCSSSRATVMSGRQPFRTGVGKHLSGSGTPWELPLDQPLLPQQLRPHYRTAAVGKWHLSVQGASGFSHPLLVGFEHHRGSFGNFNIVDPFAYSFYTKLVDGTPQQSSEYATTETVDDALELIGAFESEGPDEPRPWFLYVAFNAPHLPLHVPPAHLHSYELGLDPPAHQVIRAMLEAADTELGRLLDGLGPELLEHTLVIVAGDNGTMASGIIPPLPAEHGKGTLFEGGVRVPLVVAGPGVAKARRSAARVGLVDLYATVLAAAGRPLVGGEDSFDLAPLLRHPSRRGSRRWHYTESFKPNGPPPYNQRVQAVGSDRYKLHRKLQNGNQTLALYDLKHDPYELANLLPQSGLSAGSAKAFVRLRDVAQVLSGLSREPDVSQDVGARDVALGMLAPGEVHEFGVELVAGARVALVAKGLQDSSPPAVALFAPSGVQIKSPLRSGRWVRSGHLRETGLPETGRYRVRVMGRAGGGSYRLALRAHLGAQLRLPATLTAPAPGRVSRFDAVSGSRLRHVVLPVGTVPPVGLALRLPDGSVTQILDAQLKRGALRIDELALEQTGTYELELTLAAAPETGAWHRMRRLAPPGSETHIIAP